jgi:type IV pilus assembly protein PilX
MKSMQQGYSLIMVLIVLAVLLVTSMAFFRSSSVSNIVAGNIAFKQSALAAAEVGITQAEADLLGLTNLEADVSGVYYATQQAVDSNNLPTISWTSVPTTSVQNYTVQHIVERLCSGTLPIQNFSASCAVNQLPATASNKFGSQIYTSATSLYYRATVQVTGPQNTLVYVQAILTR